MDPAYRKATALYHDESNTMNDESVCILPEKRFGVLVAGNAYTPDVDAAFDEIANLLVQRS